MIPNPSSGSDRLSPMDEPTEVPDEPTVSGIVFHMEAHGTVTNPDAIVLDDARCEAYGTVTNPDEKD